MDFEPLVVVLVLLTTSRSASAHHEALFGPQSSLAVESQGFVSLQAHEHVFGSGDTLTRETTYILSGGISPFREIPWSFALVLPFTYENAHGAPGDQMGPSSACSGCFARENLLLSTSYRFDFEGLIRRTGKDGNFALVSGALEPPTGNKDYATFQGPFNGMFAGMGSLESGAYSAVALAYYRINASDNVGSKKGNNWLAALGFAYTPIDDSDRMISFQAGLAAEIHDRDVLAGAPVEASGGWEIFASPTIVWAASSRTRFFTYVSIPITQDYRSISQEDRWRAGLGLIYSFARGPEPLVVPPPTDN